MSDNLTNIMETVPFPPAGGSDEDGFSFAFLMPPSGDVPSWWSPSRDIYLRQFWTEVDALQAAVTTFVSKTKSIPFSIQPVDSRHRYLPLARRAAENLLYNSGTASRGAMVGWREVFDLFIQDFLTQDNGGFLYIMGNPPTASLPLSGLATGLLHLDSARCQRTGDPKFPVLYTHPIGGKEVTYKIHYTRVISISHLPSPEADMFGVGKCPVTGCLESAQELKDIATFSAEKFGSRPARQVFYVRTGATLANLQDAINHWNAKLDAQGNTRFSGTLLLAPRNPNQNLDLDVLNLASMPEGFERRDVHLIDMAMVAASFGLDLLDLALSMGVQGQTRANADVQTRKGRGKGPGLFLETFVDQINTRFLPSTLEAKADTVDDDQDQQRAEIASTRSEAYARHVQFGIRTVRSIRRQMMRDNELTPDDFEMLELEDGRLTNGISTLSLFESTEKPFTTWLVAPPEMPESVDNYVDEANQRIWADLDGNPSLEKDAHKALSALRELRKKYQPEPEPETPPDRAVERSDLESDQPVRDTERDQLPQDSLMKERFQPDSPLSFFYVPKVSPSEFSEEEIEEAVRAFEAVVGRDGLLDAKVI